MDCLHLNPLPVAMKIADIIKPYQPCCFDPSGASVNLTFPSNRDILSYVDFLISTTERKKAAAFSDLADTIVTWEGANRKDKIVK